MVFPKGPCTQIVYTWALKYSSYRYIGPKVHTIWVHGPLGIGNYLGPCNMEGSKGSSVAVQLLSVASSPASSGAATWLVPL